jgi:hypothetical protein
LTRHFADHILQGDMHFEAARLFDAPPQAADVNI